MAFKKTSVGFSIGSFLVGLVFLFAETGESKTLKNKTPKKIEDSIGKLSPTKKMDLVVKSARVLINKERKAQYASLYNPLEFLLSVAEAAGACQPGDEASGRCCIYAGTLIQMSGRVCDVKALRTLDSSRACSPTYNGKTYGSDVGVKCEPYLGGACVPTVGYVRKFLGNKSYTSMEACLVGFVRHLTGTSENYTGKYSIGEVDGDLTRLLDSSKLSSEEKQKIERALGSGPIGSANPMMAMIKQAIASCEVVKLPNDERAGCDSFKSSLEPILETTFSNALMAEQDFLRFPAKDYSRGAGSTSVAVTSASATAAASANATVSIENVFEAGSTYLNDDGTINVVQMRTDLGIVVPTEGSGDSASTTTSLPKEPECFEFSKLPDEHFCQAEVKDKKYVFRLNGAYNRAAPQPNGGDSALKGDYSLKAYSKNDDGKWCPSDDFKPKNEKGKAYQEKSKPKEPFDCGNKYSFTTSDGNKPFQISRRRERTNLCEFHMKKDGPQDLKKPKNFIVDSGITKDEYDVDAITKKLQPGNQILNRCYDPDVAALEEAMTILENRKDCQKQKFKLSLGEDDGSKDWIWPKTLWSKEIRIRHKSSLHQNRAHDDAFCPSNIRGDSGDSDNGCKLSPTKEDRVFRTTTDWLYGYNQAGKIEGDFRSQDSGYAQPSLSDVAYQCVRNDQGVQRAKTQGER